MEFSEDTIVELQDLLDQANDGDDLALANLLSRFQSRFYVLVRKMLWRYPHVRRWEQTDDVFQAAVIRLHRSLIQTKPESVRGLTGLAATQTRRTLIDLARHYYGAHGLGANHESNGGGLAADDPGGSIDRTATAPESLEDWTAFHEATAKLPNEPRETFELTWYAGLSQVETAKLLNVSRRTIIRRMNLARQLLFEMLGGELPADEKQ